MSDKKFKDTKFGKFLNKVGNTFGDVADVGGRLLEGTPAGGVLGTIGDMLNGKANDPNMTPELKKQAKQFAHELKMQEKEFAHEIEMTHLQDVKDAREQNTKIQNDPDSTMLAKIVPYGIDCLITATWIGATFYIASEVIDGIDIDNGIWGLYSTVTGMASTVLNFHRGSSMGSKVKDKLQKLSKRN